MIRLKRAYEPALASDGLRVLVERLWPRGLSREKAAIDLWLKDIAPSTALRQWYGHDEARWPEFQSRYRAELHTNPALTELRALLRQHAHITFVYASHSEHNSAAVLKAWLEQHPH